MKPTSHHYVALIIALLILVASVVGYFFIDLRVQDQVKITTTDFAKVGTEQAAATREQLATQSLDSSADARALVETFIIPDDQTVSFIEQVEGVSKQSGAIVSIASISADDLTTAAVGTIGNLHAHISITGPWKNVMRALHIVEDLPYSLNIDSVNAHAQGAGVWDIEFNIASLIVK